MNSLSKDEIEMLRLLRRGKGRLQPREVQPRTREGQWLCHYSDCIFAAKRKPMFSHGAHGLLQAQTPCDESTTVPAPSADRANHEEEGYGGERGAAQTTCRANG